MYTTSIKNKEKFCLRLLLLNVRGAKSFEDLRTYDGKTYNTFEEAAIARTLIDNDKEFDDCLDEASRYCLPKQLRYLYVTILITSYPTNSATLLSKYADYMSEDYKILYTIEQSYNMLLNEIQNQLIEEGYNMKNFGLPEPSYYQIPSELELSSSPWEKEELIHTINSLNREQEYAFSEIIDSINSKHNRKLYILDGPGGSGKTYLYNALAKHMKIYNKICIATAKTGIAGTLLLDGCTYHSTFKLYPPIDETTVYNIIADSERTKLIKNSNLILIDEVSMMYHYSLNAINRFLQNLLGNIEIFGGKIILLGGDFRHLSYADQIELN